MTPNTLLRNERILTELDHVRLSRCLRHEAARAGDLPDVLNQAHVVPGREVPTQIVTMYTMVLLESGDGGGRRRLTLCYPDDADPAAGFVSVLSPVGSALIGLPVGGMASWRTPDGQRVQARIAEILFQPEASGDYTL
jgi:regulator of nucleoside diphosphate kinase